MNVPSDIIGQFVDAAVQNRSEADGLLRQYPALKSARWVGDSLLRFLAIENYPEGVRYLAERGWAVDERDDDGTTPLMDAVRAGATDAVAALLELGADPDAVSETYDNALHSAISAGHTKMVRILLDGGANPAFTTGLGETAFDVIPNKTDKNTEIRSILKERGLVAPDA